MSHSIQILTQQDVTPDVAAEEAKASHADTTEPAPVPQIITPLPEPVDAPVDGTTTTKLDAEEVAAVIANEEKEKSAATKSTEETTEAAPAIAAAEGETAAANTTEEVKTAEDNSNNTLKTEEKSPAKSPKRSSSPFQAIKGFLRTPSHKVAKSEVGRSSSFISEIR